jgi:hypothetical protein
MLLIACFVAGLVTGVVGYRTGRKIYWHVKTPRRVRRHFSTPRYRRRLGLTLRHRYYFSARPRTYTGYHSDYRLSKLFDKLDRRDND